MSFSIALTDQGDLIFGTYTGTRPFYYFSSIPYQSTIPAVLAYIRFVDSVTLDVVSCPQIGTSYYVQTPNLSGSINYLYLLDPKSSILPVFPLPPGPSFGYVDSFQSYPSVITTFTPIGGVTYGELRIYDWEIRLINGNVRYELPIVLPDRRTDCIVCGCGIVGEICSDDGLSCYPPSDEPPPEPQPEPEPIPPEEPPPIEPPNDSCDGQPCGGACAGPCPDDLLCRVQYSGEYGCQESESGKPFYLQWWFYLILAIGIIVFVVGCVFTAKAIRRRRTGTSPDLEIESETFPE